MYVAYSTHAIRALHSLANYRKDGDKNSLSNQFLLLILQHHDEEE